MSKRKAPAPIQKPSRARRTFTLPPLPKTSPKGPWYALLDQQKLTEEQVLSVASWAYHRLDDEAMRSLGLEVYVRVAKFEREAREAASAKQ